MTVLKQQVAEAALALIPEDCVLGVGTGSTVNYLIDALAKNKHLVEATVASSRATANRLKEHGIPVIDLNTAGPLTLYIDGADECNKHLQLIKGGGGALTREKIIAAAAETFICIADESKQVDVLGTFPVPIEVIPMARSYVAREIVKLDGDPVYREDCVTDNNNIILDVYNWQIMEPLKLERQLNNIPGVVCCGIFADRSADKLLIGSEGGVQTFDKP